MFNQLQNFTGKRANIIYHTIFWLLYLSYYLSITAVYYPQRDLLTTALRYGMSLPIDIIATYFTAYYLIDNLILRKKIWQFALLFPISAFTLIILQRIVLRYIAAPTFDIAISENYSLFKFSYYYVFFNIYTIAFIFIVIRMILKSLKTQELQRNLQKEKLEAELKFLKSQIHPHFLFNTLNNLYALTLDKSDQAPEVVVKLSALLDYMLYEANVERIALEKEVTLIEQYIDLEKIRYGENVSIKFSVEGETYGKQIAPLLLLPFVENAFKHGLSRKTSEQWLDIKINVDDQKIDFLIRNSMKELLESEKPTYTEGIGLKNVNRRLDLLYQNKYKIDIQKQNEIFEVKLILELD